MYRLDGLFDWPNSRILWKVIKHKFIGLEIWGLQHFLLDKSIAVRNITNPSPVSLQSSQSCNDSEENSLAFLEVGDLKHLTHRPSSETYHVWKIKISGPVFNLSLLTTDKFLSCKRASCILFAIKKAFLYKGRSNCSYLSDEWINFIILCILIRYNYCVTGNSVHEPSIRTSSQICQRGG